MTLFSSKKILHNLRGGNIRAVLAPINRTKSSFFLAAILMALPLLAPKFDFGPAMIGTAWAGQSKEAVQGWVNMGAKLFREGDYREAMQLFEKAHTVSKEWGLLFLIGRCHEELGEYREAVRTYRVFLGGDVPPDARQRAEEAVQNLDEILALASLTLAIEPDGSQVWLNGENYGKSPLETLNLDAGSYEIRVQSPSGAEYQRQVDLVAKREVTLIIDVSKEVNTHASQHSEQMISSEALLDNKVALGLLGGGALFTVGGIVSMIMGESDHKKIVQADGYGGEMVTDITRQMALDLEDSGYKKKRVGYVLMGVGVASMVGSSAMYFFQKEEPKVVTALNPVAVPMKSGGLISFSGSF